MRFKEERIKQLYMAAKRVVGQGQGVASPECAECSDYFKRSSRFDPTKIKPTFSCPFHALKSACEGLWAGTAAELPAGPDERRSQ